MTRKIVSLFITLILSLTASTIIHASEDDLVYSHENTDKMIALTFDDGPHYKYTAEILEILKEYNVKATFFVIGVIVERYPELVVREIAEGHEVGNHTWSHPKMQKCSYAQLVDELIKTERLINEIADYRPKLFRPPEGSYKAEVGQAAENNDYNVIMWTVDTLDWMHTPPDKIVANVMKNTVPGSIILCHDFIGHDSPTPEAIRKFIPLLLEQGYQFVTVSELLSR